MNRDPKVMEHFPKLMETSETEDWVKRMEASIDANGFGFFATDWKETGRFIGFIGLGIPRFQAHFTPCVEIGWRLTPESWGRGLCTEGARRVLQFAFEDLKLKALVSQTAPINKRSWRVMEKIGMKRDPKEDFDHPSIENGHPLKRHVLYRMTAEDWLKTPYAKEPWCP